MAISRGRQRQECREGGRAQTVDPGRTGRGEDEVGQHEKPAEPGRAGCAEIDELVGDPVRPGHGDPRAHQGSTASANG